MATCKESQSSSPANLPLAACNVPAKTPEAACNVPENVPLVASMCPLALILLNSASPLYFICHPVLPPDTKPSLWIIPPVNLSPESGRPGFNSIFYAPNNCVKIINHLLKFFSVSIVYRPV